MAQDTAKGPFPSTHWSVLAGKGGPDARRSALEALARLYWRPVYAHFRLKWNRTREQAEDLTQAFFEWVLEGPFVDRVEPGHGRFRNYLKVHLDNFMRNQGRADGAQRRGGGKKFFSLEGDAGIEDVKEAAPEEVLDRQWRHVVLEEAIKRVEARLAKEGRAKVFDVLKRYDLADPARRPSYAALAVEAGIKAADVDNFLSEGRRKLYEEVRAIVAESVDGPEALKEELDGFFQKPS